MLHESEIIDWMLALSSLYIQPHYYAATSYTLSISYPRSPSPITECHLNLNARVSGREIRRELSATPLCLNPHNSSIVLASRI